MILKSKKGYSLIEIGVGVLILTVFLICSAALFNGCYNTYRMIQQRNLAIEKAVSNMELLLQTNSDILTGFFTEELDEATNTYALKVNEEFLTYVKNNFNAKFKTRYAQINNIDIGAIDTVSSSEYEEYVLKDKDYLINSYIADEVENYSDTEFNSAEVQNGSYGFLTENIIETGNPKLLSPETGEPSAILGEMAIRKTILRLPPTEESVYGNKILKLKVEVLYTNKINISAITNEDIKVLTLETIKIAE